MKKTIILVVIIAIVAVAGYMVYGKKKPAQTSTNPVGQSQDKKVAIPVSDLEQAAAQADFSSLDADFGAEASQAIR